MVDGPFDPTSFRRSPGRRKRSFPAWAYYLVAAILFAPTIPMYRYILRRGEPQPVLTFQPAPSIAQRAINAGLKADLAPVIQQEQYNQYVIQADAHHLSPAPRGRRLAADEHCVGGSIVRVDVVKGVTTYTQEMRGYLPEACPQNFVY